MFLILSLKPLWNLKTWCLCGVKKTTSQRFEDSKNHVKFIKYCKNIELIYMGIDSVEEVYFSPDSANRSEFRINGLPGKKGGNHYHFLI